MPIPRAKHIQSIGDCVNLEKENTIMTREIRRKLSEREHKDAKRE